MPELGHGQRDTLGGLSRDPDQKPVPRRALDLGTTGCVENEPATWTGIVEKERHFDLPFDGAQDVFVHVLFDGGDAVGRAARVSHRSKGGVPHLQHRAGSVFEAPRVEAPCQLELGS